MIDLQLRQTGYVAAEGEPEALQQYVRALLARQHALDLLDTIHEQINNVWGTIRRLLEGSSAARAAKAERKARAAQAIEAKNSYRSLERRREVCIAALHQAERRANVALQSLIAMGANARLKTSEFVASSPARTSSRLDCRSPRRKLKAALAA